VKPRVILIEDEYLIAASVQEMLEHLGCDVIGPVGELPAAIDLCAKADAEAAIVNLILHGKDAYSVAAILAARNIPFGFASGVDRRSNGEWADRPFLAKPYTMMDLRGFLLDVLPDHRQPD
jgi:hypothetical protein